MSRMVRLGVVLRQDVSGKRLTEGPLTEAKTRTDGCEEAPSVPASTCRVGPVRLGTLVWVVDPPEKDSEITLWPLPVFQLFLYTVNRVSNWARQNWSHYLFSKSILSLTFPKATEMCKSQGLRARCCGLGSSLVKRGSHHSLSFSPPPSSSSFPTFSLAVTLWGLQSSPQQCPQRSSRVQTARFSWKFSLRVSLGWDQGIYASRRALLYFLWEAWKALFWNGSPLHGLAHHQVALCCDGLWKAELTLQIQAHTLMCAVKETQFPKNNISELGGGGAHL